MGEWTNAIRTMRACRPALTRLLIGKSEATRWRSGRSVHEAKFARSKTQRQGGHHTAEDQREGTMRYASIGFSSRFFRLFRECASEGDKGAKSEDQDEQYHTNHAGTKDKTSPTLPAPYQQQLCTRVHPSKLPPHQRQHKHQQQQQRQSQTPPYLVVELPLLLGGDVRRCGRHDGRLLHPR